MLQSLFIFFFFNDTATTEIYTLSLHDALPISSCNKDYSCLNGDCPSFLTVVPRGTAARKARRVFTVDRELSPPPLRGPRDANVFMMGIGGSGGGGVPHRLRTGPPPYAQARPPPRPD